MIDKIDENLSLVNAFDAQSKEEVEAFRIKYLGKKGILSDFFKAFKEVPPKEKKDYGQALNTLKNAVMEKVKTLQLQTNNSPTQGNQGDLSRPGFPLELGSRHPLSLVKDRIVEIFSQIGFNISEGPEIEDDWHNFTALNLPEFHPARDMQDTFFIQTDPDILLRTHTSSVQVRYMDSRREGLASRSKELGLDQSLSVSGRSWKVLIAHAGSSAKIARVRPPQDLCTNAISSGEQVSPRSWH